MANLMPSDIVGEVRTVLLNAARGKDTRLNFLTAYQILNRLPLKTREQLVNERTKGGQGAGVEFAAPGVVSKAARMIPGVVVEYMDSVGLSVQVGVDSLIPSFPVIGLYRLDVVADAPA